MKTIKQTNPTWQDAQTTKQAKRAAKQARNIRKNKRVMWECVQ